MSILFIKESYVYEFREVGCNTDGCGYWRSPDDHSMGDSKPLRMFKVNGVQHCEGCLLDTMNEICDWLDDVEEESKE